MGKKISHEPIPKIFNDKTYTKELGTECETSFQTEIDVGGSNCGDVKVRTMDTRRIQYLPHQQHPELIRQLEPCLKV